MGNEDDGLAGLYASSEDLGEYRTRSINLFDDPKMRELKHYAKSHNHEQRLRANAELEGRRRRGHASQETDAEAAAALASALRTDGRESVDLHMKRLATVKETVPPRGGHNHIPIELLREDPDMDPLARENREALLRRMDRFHTRLQWRDHMDQSLNRLMEDIELARDDRLKEYAHKARCVHLDKIHDWYLTHGMKEARKERAAPPYVRFNVDGPVMPGSMRVLRTQETSHIPTPPSHQGGERPISKSASLPTLARKPVPWKT